MKMHRLFAAAAILLALIPVACSKYETNIPSLPVRLTLNLSYADKDLMPLYAHKVFTKARYAGEYVGYAGVLVVHGNNDTYYAYDLCCPYEGKKSTVVTPSDDGTATCATCGSKFDIASGGFRIDGPELAKGDSYKAYLRTYTVVKSGMEILIEN